MITSVAHDALETYMPQLSPVAVADGTATHTFAPRGIDSNGVATLVVSSGVPIGDKRMTVQRSRTTQGREKVTIKMTLPVVSTETVNGIANPKIVRSAYVDLAFGFEGTSTSAERKAARVMIADFLLQLDGPANELIDDLESLY